MKPVTMSCAAALLLAASLGNGAAMAELPRPDGADSAQALPPAPVAPGTVRTLGPLRVEPGANYSLGDPQDGGSWSGRSLLDVTVYDSTHVHHYQTGDPADFVFAATVSAAGDGLTLSLPRTGMGPFGPRYQLLDQVTFAMSHLDRLPSGVTVDSYHFWYDDLVTWTGDGNCVTRTPLGGFYIADLFLEPCDPGTCATSFTVTNLAELGIVFDDNFVAYEQVISFTGSGGLPIEDPNGLMVFSGDGTDGGLSGANAVGESTDTINILGNCYASFGGAPHVANVYVSLGVQYCDADFDGTGFCDLDDFGEFVAAFEAGC